MEKIGYDFENQEHYVYFRNDYLNMFGKHTEHYSKVMPVRFLFNYAKANKKLKEIEEKKNELKSYPLNKKVEQRS